jgi:hypothetical protein
MVFLRVMDTQAEILLLDASEVARGELDLGEMMLEVQRLSLIQ